MARKVSAAVGLSSACKLRHRSSNGFSTGKRDPASATYVFMAWERQRRTLRTGKLFRTRQICRCFPDALGSNTAEAVSFVLKLEQIATRGGRVVLFAGGSTDSFALSRQGVGYGPSASKPW